MQVLEQAILETTQGWEREGIAQGRMGPIIGAVDETFLQCMMLVFMDLASGYLLFEESAADRTYDTWRARVLWSSYEALPDRASVAGRGFDAAEFARGRVAVGNGDRGD